jgi:hypothetical protein
MKKQPEIEAPPNPFTVEQILRLYEVGILSPDMSSREALSAAFDWFGFMGFPINEDEAAEPFKLETIDFDEEPTPPSFFVQDVVVEGQALVIGGPEKTMKTSIAIALGIALATGTPFLGRFPVTTPVRTLLISKESGADKLKNTRQRILASLGMGEADGFLLSTQQDFKVAKNTNAKDFRKWVEDRGVGCVIIDPAYLILETSGKEASMYGMGPLLNRFREMCGNALPVVLHHTNRALPEKTLPQLKHLAFSGLQQWARQWILLNRASPYKPGGVHKLVAAIGGSQGHSGHYEIEIDEGEFKDGGLAKWEVNVRNAEEAGQALKRLKTTERLQVFVQSFIAQPKLTVAQRREVLKLNGNVFTQLKTQAIEDGYLSNGLPNGGVKVTDKGRSFAITCPRKNPVKTKVKP